MRESLRKREKKTLEGGEYLPGPRSPVGENHQAQKGY